MHEKLRQMEGNEKIHWVAHVIGMRRWISSSSQSRRSHQSQRVQAKNNPVALKKVQILQLVRTHQQSSQVHVALKTGTNERMNKFIAGMIRQDGHPSWALQHLILWSMLAIVCLKLPKIVGRLQSWIDPDIWNYCTRRNRVQSLTLHIDGSIQLHIKHGRFLQETVIPL